MQKLFASIERGAGAQAVGGVEFLRGVAGFFASCRRGRWPGRPAWVRLRCCCRRRDRRGAGEDQTSTFQRIVEHGTPIPATSGRSAAARWCVSRRKPASPTSRPLLDQYQASIVDGQGWHVPAAIRSTPMTKDEVAALMSKLQARRCQSRGVDALKPRGVSILLCA